MKATEIREFTKEELVTKELELKDQLFKLRFQHTLGQLENSVKMKTVRRDIAKIKTILIEMSKKTATEKVAVQEKEKGKEKGKGKGTE